MKTAALIAAVSILAGAAQASPVRVIDGDTIDLNGMPIRILGIDTPETFRPRCENERALGVAAKARLIELLDGVEVTYEATSYDHYDRVLAYVYAGNVNVGAKLLEEGLALSWSPGPKAKAKRLEKWCGPAK